MMGTLPARWRIGAAVAVAFMLIGLVRATRPVRLANGDDIAIQAAIASREPGAQEHFFADWGAHQGRFYFRVPTYRLPYAIYRIQNATLFASARVALLIAQLSLAGWLLARLLQDEASGWLYVVGALGALHIPAVLYPVLSYPAFSAASVALLLALHCYVTGLGRSSGRWLYAAGLLHLYALLCHENFIVFTLLYPALDWALRPGAGLGGAIRRSLPLILVSCAYAVTYLAFRHLFPTGYDGTAMSLSPGPAALSWIRQTLAAVPGFELFINRQSPYPTVGPLWKSAGQVAEIVRLVPLPWAALALGCALLAAGLALRAAARAEASARIAWVFLLAAALPNVLPSFAQKYQESAHHRFYPYVYSFSCYCFGLAAAAVLWALCNRAAAQDGARRPLRAAALFLLFAALFVSALASNRHTLELLRQWYN